MFQTTLTPAAPARLGEAAPPGVPAWPDLVARLAAARDLRQALRGTRSRGGSFTRLARSMESVNAIGLPVNPNDLASGKAAGAHRPHAIEVDRETR